MKRISFFRVFLFLTVFSACAMANTTPPYTLNLTSMPHSSYYVWGIDFSVPTGQQITGAVLTYHDIYDWRNETDRLSTHLLDDPRYKGSSWLNGQHLKSGTDADNGTDYFATTYSGTQVLVGNWDDPDGPTTKGDLVYDFATYGVLDDLQAYAATLPPADSGTGSNKYRSFNFGFGIDPDCAYYLCGMTFEITTGPIPIPPPPNVPVPGAVLLGGIGVAIVGWLRGRRTL